MVYSRNTGKSKREASGRECSCTTLKVWSILSISATVHKGCSKCVRQDARGAIRTIDNTTEVVDSARRTAH
ncbi:uncharacterized protein L203_106459 [Cryptococcus depauperatus CBS 7841]|uniref:Uncharacterized protein n=1 Tax=Cryptococcus depauperatus CBS 7841 TaxID=1295531 RepID=A0AAJ8M504_9TREE